MDLGFFCVCFFHWKNWEWFSVFPSHFLFVFIFGLSPKARRCYFVMDEHWTFSELMCAPSHSDDWHVLNFPKHTISLYERNESMCMVFVSHWGGVVVTHFQVKEFTRRAVRNNLTLCERIIKSLIHLSRDNLINSGEMFYIARGFGGWDAIILHRSVNLMLVNVSLSWKLIAREEKSQAKPTMSRNEDKKKLMDFFF